MTIPTLLSRPGKPGEVSSEKSGALVAALVAVLGWALDRWAPGLIPRELLPAVAVLVLSAVSWRAREKRGKDPEPPKE